MPRITDTSICECGHVWDEHEEGKSCCVEDCKCIHFDMAEDQDAEEN